MPEKVVSQHAGVSTSSDATSFFSFWKRGRQGDEEDVGLRDAIRKHALQFFIGHGGKEEDFGEAEERNIREQMYNKWKQSEWGQARTRKREAKSGMGKKWLGSSFDVGVFLGVDIINKPSSSHITDYTSNGTASRVPMTRASTAADTFVTARSHPSPPTDVSSDHRASQYTDLSRNSSLLPAGLAITRPISGDSTTHLLLSAAESQDELRSIRKTRSEFPRRPSAGPSVSFASTRHGDLHGQHLTVPRDRKGKGKMVHYSMEALSAPPREDASTPDPVPPEEVLARSGSEVEDTSAGAAQQATDAVSIPPSQSDVIMRGIFCLRAICRCVSYCGIDRMMVQISFTSGTLGPNFDSAKNRVTPHIQYEDHSEYLVVWRKERLELYKNYVRDISLERTSILRYLCLQF